MDAQAAGFKAVLDLGAPFTTAIYAFNFRAATYLHPDRRAQLLPELPERLWRAGRVQERLSEEVLERAGISSAPCFDIPHADWVLALLPTDRLARLAMHIGALALGASVRNSLSREQVLGWKQKLGSDAYRFAMTSAALLSIGKLPELKSHDPLNLGYSLMTGDARRMPEGMRERFLLKLPSDLPPLTLDDDIARRLVQTAVNVIEGEWCSSIALIRN
ncbi:MAG: hypothetical protein RL404_1331, partial [Pseudomonadota bacterium]